MAPDRAVRELDLLDPVIAVADRPFDRDPVLAAGDLQYEMIAVLGLLDADIARDDGGIELDDVGG